MTRVTPFRAKHRFTHLLLVGIVAAAGLVWPPAAAAQLARVGGTTPTLVPGSIMRGTDVAYDPGQDIYLHVVGHGPVYGIFVNASGQPISERFTIWSELGTFAHFPRAEYGAHVNNGVGGQGAFLVTWIHNIGRVNYVFGRVVSAASPARVVSAVQQISGGEELGTWHETGPAMAYSASSLRFLVAWRTLQYGIRARFVDTNGTPFGEVMALENPGGSRDPALAWNPGTNEFGLMSTGFGNSGAFAAFRRIRAADGFVFPRTSFAFSTATFATGIDVNTATNHYVVAWAVHPGTMSALFDPFGTLVGSNFVTGRQGYDQSLDLKYNAASGTFLSVASMSDSLEVGAVELKGNGAPHTSSQAITDGARLGSFYPMTTRRGNTNQWNVVYSRDFQGATNQIVGTFATGGGGGSTPTPPPPPPPTPPPPPPPPPAPTCGGIPDPFTALGGGTCCNGGWLPPGIACGGTPAPAPAPPPPPPPPTSTCSTPNPFSALGGGTCCNGGWLPPGMACNGVSSPAPPPPSSSTCLTPKPALGNWTCVNGGWVPLTCTIPDPFVSLGGGVCINGGWVPRG